MGDRRYCQQITQYLQTSSLSSLLLVKPILPPGAARNLGAEHSSSTFLFFLDDDDYWLPWHTYVQLRSVTSHDFSSTSSLGEISFWRGLSLYYFTPVRAWLTFFFPFLPVVLVNKSYSSLHGNTSSLVVKRLSFLACGGFCDSRMFAEDKELIVRLYAYNFSGAYLSFLPSVVFSAPLLNRSSLSGRNLKGLGTVRPSFLFFLQLLRSMISLPLVFFVSIVFFFPRLVSFFAKYQYQFSLRNFLFNVRIFPF